LRRPHRSTLLPSTTLFRSKITKIFQPTETELLFTIRFQGKNHSLLFSIHPTYARFHITKDIYQNPQEPPMFCMLLRNHLSGAVLDRKSTRLYSCHVSCAYA